MQMLIECRAFETIVGDMVAKLQHDVGATLQRVTTSGKMVAGGVFADGRGIFLLMNITEPSDLFDLLGVEIYDSCRIDIHPIISFEKLGEFFAKIGTK